jgi:hypothetical protein
MKSESDLSLVIIMNKLISYSCSKLVSEKPNWNGLDKFLTFYEYFPSNIGVYDRSGATKFPVQCENKWPIPNWNKEFSWSYDECVMFRAKELIELSKKTGKKIRLYYSGGIDSSTIFCSFLDLLGLSDMPKYIELACTFQSRRENPYIWNNFIRKVDFTLFDASNTNQILDVDRIIVMGECNDQLFGSDALINFQIHTSEANAYNKYSVDSITDYFGKFNKQYASYWAERLTKSMKAAPFEIENHYQFFWWYNFAWKWNNVAVRILFYLNEDQENILNENTLPVQFFNTEYFQQWSLTNHYNEPDKNASPQEYKMVAKQFVAKSINENGFLHKVKNPSLFRIFYSNVQNYGITSDYKIIRDWRKLEQFI